MNEQSRNSVPAIVLGCHKLGLGVIRSLGEKKIPVVGVYYHRMDMGYVSKYVTASYHCPHPDHDEQQFITFLTDLAAQFRGSVLIPSDDTTLVPVSKHKSALMEHFRVNASDWDLTEKFISKENTYHIAETYGIPAPKTCVPESLSEAERFALLIGFPCILKPSVSHRFFEIFRKKMLVLQNMEQLEDAYVKSRDVDMKMMLQEFIPGDDRSGVNYNSFFVNGEAIVEVTAEKLRLTPPGTGFPRAIVSKMIPEIIEPGRQLLRALGYNGFSCMEFKKDARDGTYKLMEVNGRHNLSTLLSTVSGINFPYLTYRYMLYNELPSSTGDFIEGTYWIDIGKDLVESIRSYRTERLTFREFVKPYLNPHVFSVLSLEDPMPFLKRAADIGKEGLSRIFRKSPSGE